MFSIINNITKLFRDEGTSALTDKITDLEKSNALLCKGIYSQELIIADLKAQLKAASKSKDPLPTTDVLYKPVAVNQLKELKDNEETFIDVEHLCLVLGPISNSFIFNKHVIGLSQPKLKERMMARIRKNKGKLYVKIKGTQQYPIPSISLLQVETINPEYASLYLQSQRFTKKFIDAGLQVYVKCNNFNPHQSVSVMFSRMFVEKALSELDIIRQSYLDRQGKLGNDNSFSYQHHKFSGKDLHYVQALRVYQYGEPLYYINNHPKQSFCISFVDKTHFRCSAIDKKHCVGGTFCFLIIEENHFDQRVKRFMDSFGNIYHRA